ncbi:DgyrCDS13713 [Dimorphilus gyrociliatus]|nr:DgyrCDS13713 [Dimorphilus gyrociliatus]
MTGKLIELGPWRVNKQGRLSWFEERWNKHANIIFMESPACVGFSYDDDSNCATSDDETAEHNYNAMKDFFVGWPELVDNILYITGESYAGVYVPTLSVLLANDASLNFKGMAIGNPVSNRRMMTNSLTYFAYSRGIIGVEMWNDLLDNCCVDRNATDCNFYRSEDDQCAVLSSEVNRQIWRNGLNPYNLYDTCFGGVPSHDDGILKKEGNIIEIAPIDMLPPDFDIDRYQENIRDYIKKGYQVRSRIPCSDSSGRESFLNDVEVRRALHVKDGLPQWQPCSAIVSAQYIRQYTDLKPQHMEILEKGHRVLKYSGDLDMACNHWGDLWFSEDLGLEV